jgi:hypothetical protein
MGKKPKHRVRHVPPGPCGIWFQATQAKKKQRRSNSIIRDNRSSCKRSSWSAVDVSNGPKNGQSEDPHNNSDYDMTQHNPYTQDHDGKSPEKNSHKLEDTPSAWQEMQSETHVTTPYNPTPWTTVIDPEERYQVVRSNLPEHYVTLWEILRGDCDMKLAPHHRLRVLVHAVEMSHHHNIWTVDLRDDTGASIRAWMEPRFIQEQLQNSMMDDNEMSMIRPGLVWMLRDVSMIIVQSSLMGSNSSFKMSEERLERMLLISGQNVEKIWYPTEKDKGDGDSQQQQQQTNHCSNVLVDNSKYGRSQQPPESYTTIESTPNGKQSMYHEYSISKSKNVREDDDEQDHSHIDDGDLLMESRKNSNRPLETLDMNSISDSRPCTQLTVSPTRKQDRRRGNTIGSVDACHPFIRSNQPTRQHEHSVNESCSPGEGLHSSLQTLTIETATVYDSQVHGEGVGQSQSIHNMSDHTTTTHSQEVGLKTQDSNWCNKRDTSSGISAMKRQTSSHDSQQPKEDRTHTVKSSQALKTRRTNYYCSSALGRDVTTQDLSPTRFTPPMLCPKRSPRKKVFTVRSMWTIPSQFILDMIEQDEKQCSLSNKSPSCHPTTTKTDESSTTAESQSPTLFYRRNGSCEKLYDPSSWTGVDMEALD